MKFCWACGHDHRGRDCDVYLSAIDGYIRENPSFLWWYSWNRRGAVWWPCRCTARNLYDGREE